ncbi:MAG TPA: hypothetical protein VKR62_11295, partial [Roseiarcus sp.]|nr:hypothetical protein [Roseiarcus sp.]
LALLPASALLPSSWAHASGAEADPVYAAMTAHRQAYDVFCELWDLTHGGMQTEDEASKRRWYEVNNAEETTFNALLATKPTTKAGAIACVEHVIDIGRATDEMRNWLAMLLESPLAE